MLTDNEIKKRGLVRDTVPGNFRAASYDLRIGKLVAPGGEVVDTYKLPPQGIVEAIAEETIALPGDVAGIAMVKTHLCQEGILALSIGIIDPGFEGRISSFLVNFGKETRLLQSGEVFLRTIYQRVDGTVDNPQPFKSDFDKSMRDRRRAAVEKFEPTFLSIDTVASKSAEQIFTTYRNRMLAYVSAAALLLAILTFLVNFSTIWLKWQETPGASKVADDLRTQNDELRKRIEALERRGAATPRPPAAAPAGAAAK